MTQIAIDGRTRIYGLIGYPVSHSLSPAMQTDAFQQIGINAVYLPFPIEPDDLSNLIDSFTLIHVEGFNVTVPYKQKIIPYLDTLSPEASQLGSVNTVIYSEGVWKGFSTDGQGFISALKKDNIDPSGKKVIIFGAGGSCRAIAFALSQSKLASLTVINRTVEKAQTLLREVKNVDPSLRIHSQYQIGESYDILINTTSMGMNSSDCPVPDEVISQCGYIIDIIYSPLETTLLKKAKQEGIPHQNGIEMLLGQGVASFEIWTGKKAPIATMRSKLLETLPK